jgi:hypothetical protein
MKNAKVTLNIVFVLAASCYSINFSMNFPFPLATATGHFGDGISDTSTSYIGINMFVTSNKLYSELNYELLIPIIWTEGKWSDLESEKDGSYITGTAQYKLTDNDMFNFYIGPSAFGYIFSEDKIDDSYFGAGLSTTCTFTKYNHDKDIVPMTLLLSFGLNTDGHTLLYNPKLTFVSFGFYDDISELTFNVVMNVELQISSNYTYLRSGMALGFVF